MVDGTLDDGACVSLIVFKAKVSKGFGMTELQSDRDTCVLSILKSESPASTKRIIELASTDEFKAICKDCKSGIEVYETAMRLNRAGAVVRKPGPGGFLWALVDS